MIFRITCPRLIIEIQSHLLMCTSQSLCVCVWSPSYEKNHALNNIHQPDSALPLFYPPAFNFLDSSPQSLIISHFVSLPFLAVGCRVLLI